MQRKTAAVEKLEFKRRVLAELRSAYIELIAGRVQSYTIGTRSLTRHNLKDLEELIAKTEKEVDELDAKAQGKRPRRAIGVVPRDW